MGQGNNGRNWLSDSRSPNDEVRTSGDWSIIRDAVVWNSNDACDVLSIEVSDGKLLVVTSADIANTAISVAHGIGVHDGYNG